MMRDMHSQRRRSTYTIHEHATETLLYLLTRKSGIHLVRHDLMKGYMISTKHGPGFEIDHVILGAAGDVFGDDEEGSSGIFLRI